MALFGDDRKIRYAVVGLGWIAQEVVLPGFKGAKHSELTALVTGDPEKAQQLGKKYGVEHVTNYDRYDELLRSGNIDAVYIALPNHMHLDFTVRAARAGIHVLCEKPMADTVAECEEMIRVAEESRIKLMIAYRLHFEPANLKAVEIVQGGELGDPKIFSSVFTQQVPPGNIRLKRSMGGGPLMDMGVYPINAARYLFRDEPTEVTGFGIQTPDPRFTEVHETAGGVLRFPGDKIAVFTISFGGSPTDSYQVVGSKGTLLMKPAFDYHEPLEMTLAIDGKEKQTAFDQVDQFGGEIEYFSRCVLQEKDPEPSGQEGLADIRIVQALLESMRSGRTVNLPPYTKQERPSGKQKMEKSWVRPEKDLVNAQAAS